MSETQDFGATEFEGSEEESAVIKQLRSKERADAKRLKELEEQVAQFEASYQSARESSAKEIVDSFGLPGLKDDVLNWVEGEITVEAVTEALKERNIPLSDDPGQPEPESPKIPVSEVGQRVADAATGKGTKETMDRINEADDMDELKAIMEEASLTRSHS